MRCAPPVKTIVAAIAARFEASTGFTASPWVEKPIGWFISQLVTPAVVCEETERSAQGLLQRLKAETKKISTQFLFLPNQVLYYQPLY